MSDLEIELTSAKAEIERLTAENILLNTNTTEITSASFLFEMANQRERAERFKQKWIAEIKTEAYKEFAERLCEDRMSNDNTVILAKCLLKEMVGEDK